MKAHTSVILFTCFGILQTKGLAYLAAIPSIFLYNSSNSCSLDDAKIIRCKCGKPHLLIASLAHPVYLVAFSRSSSKPVQKLQWFSGSAPFASTILMSASLILNGTISIFNIIIAYDRYGERGFNWNVSSLLTCVSNTRFGRLYNKWKRYNNNAYITEHPIGMAVCLAYFTIAWSHTLNILLNVLFGECKGNLCFMPNGQQRPYFIMRWSNHRCWSTKSETILLLWPLSVIKSVTQANYIHIRVDRHWISTLKSVSFDYLAIFEAMSFW